MDIGRRKFIQINDDIVRASGIYACSDRFHGDKYVNVMVCALQRLQCGATLDEVINHSEKAKIRINNLLNSDALKDIPEVHLSNMVAIPLDTFDEDLCGRSAETRPSRLKEQFKIIAEGLKTIGIYEYIKKEGQDIEVECSMFNGVVRYDNYVYLHFNPWVMHKIKDKHFGYGLCYIDLLLALKTGYAGSLLMLLCRYLPAIKTGKWSNNTEYKGFTAEKVYSHMGFDRLTKKTSNVKNIKLIEKAVDELNDSLNLGITLEKLHNVPNKPTAVSHFVFHISNPEIIEVHEKI